MILKKRIIPISFLLMLILISSVFFTPRVKAAKDESVGAGFYVSANLPENQRNRGKTYYDLSVKPDGKQELSFQVVNTGNEPIVVSLEINNAYTNTAGEIGYQLSGIKDESLLVSMEEMATLSQNRVELRPKESEEIFINLVIPQKPFSGEIIGGIVATKEIPKQESENNSSIVNEYSYIIGLVVSQTEEIVNPNLTFVGIEPKLVNYKTAAVHSIRNSAPVLMNNVSLEIEIFSKDGLEPVWSQQREGLKLAPSSLMDYTFYLGEEDIQPGKYKSNIKINWEEDQWEFQGTFVIESATASQLNSEAIRLNEKTSQISKPIAIILVSLLVLILLILILVVIRLYRKIDKNQEKKSEYD